MLSLYWMRRRRYYYKRRLFFVVKPQPWYKTTTRKLIFLYKRKKHFFNLLNFLRFRLIKRLFQFKRFRKINGLRFLKKITIFRVRLKGIRRFVKVKFRRRSKYKYKILRRLRRFTIKYKFYFFSTEKTNSWNHVARLITKFSFFIRFLRKKIWFGQFRNRLVGYFFFRQHIRRLRYYIRKRRSKKWLFRLKRLSKKFPRNMEIYNRKMVKFWFIALKLLQFKRFFKKYGKSLSRLESACLFRRIKFYRLNKIIRAKRFFENALPVILFNFFRGDVINRFIRLRFNYLNVFFFVGFKRKPLKIFPFINLINFSGVSVYRFYILNSYSRVINFSFKFLTKKQFIRRVKKSFYQNYFILNKKVKKYRFKRKRIKKLLISKFKLKRFKIRGFFYFPRKRILYKIYVKRKAYFRRMRFRKKSFLNRLELNNIRNHLLYVFNILRKKSFKMFIFVGSVLNCFYNSTYKQYNYLLNISFKNFMFIPFFSVINLLRAQVTRLLFYNKLMIDLFKQVFEFSKVWFQKLKGIRRRRKGYYRIRKRVFFSSRYVYSTKKIRSYKFIKNFKSRRPRSLRFLYLRDFSNKFILKNSVKVHRFFLRLNVFNHLVFAWKNFRANFIWTNRNVSQYLRFKKIRNLGFFYKMNVFSYDLNIIYHINLKYHSYLRLIYYWRYFVLQRKKFSNFFLILFIYIRYTLKLSVTLLCHNLIN